MQPTKAQWFGALRSHVELFVLAEHLECYIETKPKPHYEEAIVGQENMTGVTEGR